MRRSPAIFSVYMPIDHATASSNVTPGPGVVSLHVNAGHFSTTARRVTSPTWGPPSPCKQALRMIIWLHWALIWVSKTASGGVKIASKVEGKISVHHCLLLHAQRHNVISYFMLHFKASHYLTFSSYQNKSCYFNFLRRTLACP